MEVEWLILADYAQVIGHKLYLQGGGWDRLTVKSAFPVTHTVALAASFRVPWDRTNEKHQVEIEVQSDDGVAIAKVGGQFEVGRPTGITPGQTQRFQIAANAALQLKGPGTYAIVARMGGEERARTHFNVIAGPALAGKPPAT